jgi:mono/diheme cytochrome c family protein
LQESDSRVAVQHPFVTTFPPRLERRQKNGSSVMSDGTIAGERAAGTGAAHAVGGKRRGWRWARRIGLGLVGLVALAATALFAAAEIGERKMQRQISVAVSAVALREDPAGLERGRYLYMSRGCMDCHGADGGGRVVVDDGKGMLVKGPDITPGPGGVVADYSVTDWVRTIRHGVKPDGRPAMVMPSEDYNRLSDEDVGAMIAFLRRMPPADGGPAVLELPMLVKALYAVGMVKDAAGKIDHRLAPAAAVPEGVTLEHGAYVANACIGCHGPRLEGGRIPGTPPDWPPAANLRSDGSAMRAYADADAFATMLKTGKRPDGSEVNRVMPFMSLKEMNDTDVRALFMYLRSLPPA